jgi:hypothetical protein
MLIRPRSNKRFPKNDLSYLAFVITAETLYLAFQEATEGEPHGFLDPVPLLARVPAAAQLDLLAEVWAHHDTPRAYRATLLDGAVLYSACHLAALTLREELVVAQVAVEGAPRQLDIRSDRWTRDRVEALYPRWWFRFDPREVEDANSPVLADFPRALVAPRLEAVHREGPFPALGRRLRGLMSPRQTRELLELLEQE